MALLVLQTCKDAWTKRALEAPSRRVGAQLHRVGVRIAYSLHYWNPVGETAFSAKFAMRCSGFLMSGIKCGYRSAEFPTSAACPTPFSASAIWPCHFTPRRPHFHP